MNRANLKLVDTNTEIRNKILNAMRDAIGDAFNAAKSPIIQRIRPILAGAIISHPTIQNLFGGELQGELGVVNPRDRMNQIIHTWTQSLQVNIIAPRVVGSRISGGLEVVAVPGDYHDVLGLDVAHYYTEKDDTEIKWLSWILTEGVNDLVFGYNSEFNLKPWQKAHVSRTHLAIMVPQPGFNWRVPAQFAGMPDNNFVTQAIESIEDSVADIIETEIVAKL